MRMPIDEFRLRLWLSGQEDTAVLHRECNQFVRRYKDSFDDDNWQHFNCTKCYQSWRYNRTNYSGGDPAKDRQKFAEHFEGLEFEEVVVIRLEQRETVDPGGQRYHYSVGVPLAGNKLIEYRKKNQIWLGNEV